MTTGEEKGNIMGTKALVQVEDVVLVTSAVIDNDGFDFLETAEPGLVFEEVRELCDRRGSIVPLPKSISQSEELFNRSTEVFETDSLSFFIGNLFCLSVKIR